LEIYQKEYTYDARTPKRQISVKRTINNTTTAGINYEELYDCKWDTTALKNNILCTWAFKFLYIFWPDDGLHRPKLVANI